MGQPAAKQGDKVTGTDTHLFVMPSGPPAPMPVPFSGTLDSGLSPNVKIMGKAAAVVGSAASNQPPHVQPPGTARFSVDPKNKGTVQLGSQTVKINGKPAARNGDKVLTCNDPLDLPVGSIAATGTVNIG